MDNAKCFAFILLPSLPPPPFCSHDSTPLPIKLEPKAGSTAGYLTCATSPAGVKVFQFPAGIFEIGVQWLVPGEH